jgi:hypothetical protein
MRKIGSKGKILLRVDLASSLAEKAYGAPLAFYPKNDFSSIAVKKR